MTLQQKEKQLEYYKNTPILETDLTEHKRLRQNSIN